MKHANLTRVETNPTALERFVTSLYSVSDLPETLYHYTSTKGLLGILDQKALWASELRYLNDSAELTYGYGLLLSEVRARRRSAGQNTGLLEQLESWLDYRSRLGPMVFVAAFTRHGNLLSQWRAYCPPAGGVSFGVSSSHLSVVCKRNRFSLARCVYATDQHHDLVARLVQHLIAAAEAAGPNALAQRNESFYPVFLDVEESIVRVCAVLKHSAFQEEVEWRAVSSVDSDFVKGEGAKINYRAGASMLIPYISLPLAGSDGIIPIDVVITGPTPDSAAARLSVRRLVEKHLNRSRGFESRDCEIPFRAW